MRPSQRGLESDLEARTDALGRQTGSLLAPALASGNRAAVASIVAPLLEHGDIEQVDVMDASGGVVFTRSRFTRRLPPGV